MSGKVLDIEQPGVIVPDDLYPLHVIGSEVASAEDGFSFEGTEVSSENEESQDGDVNHVPPYEKDEDDENDHQMSLNLEMERMRHEMEERMRYEMEERIKEQELDFIDEFTRALRR